MITYYMIPFILAVMFISFAITTNTFATINFVDFTITFYIAVVVSLFIEYTKKQSKYLLFLRRYF
ncbi:hypothetical protein CRU96_02665 [Malaciobacter halophilus]|nr:hypothetical protein [Malaciobacter halophilus]RYA24554.1 hypothetical protein CRU96_02665 [Malaciobacter halophilus]